MGQIKKIYPGEDRPVSIDFTNDLADGASISSATWTAPAGVFTVGAAVNSGSQSTVKVTHDSGVVIGTIYGLTCVATDTDGNQLEDTVYIQALES